MSPCDFCEDGGCKFCSVANPCYRCADYDKENDTCKSKGGCASYGADNGGGT